MAPRESLAGGPSLLAFSVPRHHGHCNSTVPGALPNAALKRMSVLHVSRTVFAL